MQHITRRFFTLAIVAALVCAALMFTVPAFAEDLPDWAHEIYESLCGPMPDGGNLADTWEVTTITQDGPVTTEGNPEVTETTTTETTTTFNVLEWISDPEVVSTTTEVVENEPAEAIAEADSDSWSWAESASSNFADGTVSSDDGNASVNWSQGSSASSSASAGAWSSAHARALAGYRLERITTTLLQERGVLITAEMETLIQTIIDRLLTETVVETVTEYVTVVETVIETVIEYIEIEVPGPTEYVEIEVPGPTEYVEIEVPIVEEIEVVVEEFIDRCFQQEFKQVLEVEVSLVYFDPNKAYSGWFSFPGSYETFQVPKGSEANLGESMVLTLGEPNFATPEYSVDKNHDGEADFLGLPHIIKNTNFLDPAKYPGFYPDSGDTTLLDQSISEIRAGALGALYLIEDLDHNQDEHPIGEYYTNQESNPDAILLVREIGLKNVWGDVIEVPCEEIPGYTTP